MAKSSGSVLTAIGIRVSLPPSWLTSKCRGHTPFSIAQPLGFEGAFLAVSCNRTRACEVVGQGAFGGGLITMARPAG